MATKNNYIYKKYIIYLVVPDKKKIFNKIKKTNKTSEHITDHMTNILDKNDLNNYFLLFKQDIIKNNDWSDICHQKKI